MVIVNSLPFARCFSAEENASFTIERHTSKYKTSLLHAFLYASYYPIHSPTLFY